MNHTPEPWGVYPLADDNDLPAILSGDGKLELLISEVSDEESIANVERAVSCVNACAGIPDPETTVPELVAALRSICEQVHQYAINDENELPDCDAGFAALVKINHEKTPDTYVCDDCGKEFTDGRARDDHFMSPDCRKHQPTLSSAEKTRFSNCGIKRTEAKT